MPVVLSHLEVFLYGALGALGALLVVQVLPWALSLMHGHAKIEITVGRAVGAALVILIFLALGGLTALLISDDTTPAKVAIAYGLGWQSTIGGFIQGTRTIE